MDYTKLSRIQDSKLSNLLGFTKMDKLHSDIEKLIASEESKGFIPFEEELNEDEFERIKVWASYLLDDGQSIYINYSPEKKGYNVRIFR